LMLIYWPGVVYEFYHTPTDTASHTSKSDLLEAARLTALIALKLSQATVNVMSATVSRTHLGTEIETSAQEQPTTAVLGIEVIVILGAMVAITVTAAAFHYGRRRK